MSQSSGNVPLSSRQMQELLRGNHKNMVSIQASGEYICAIERVLAQHFSPVWRQRLENPDVKIVHIDIPNPAPAESLGEIPSENAPTGDTGIALTIGSGNEPSAKIPEENASLGAAGTTMATDLGSNSSGKIPEEHRPLGADPLSKTSIKFLIQWMQRGGADPSGKNALKYPQSNPVALQKLHHLATSLAIDPLITRTTGDLAALKPAIKPLPAIKPATKRGVKPVVCFLCRAPGHVQRTCVYCKYCRERSHFVADCPKLKAKLVRDEEQAKWKAWKEKDQARRDGERARREEKDKKYMIARGELAIGDGGKTMPMWPFLGR